MAKVRAHLTIRGLVQGVFYRSSLKQVAEEYGVVGWVRNRPDGSVEAVLEGEEEAVEAVIRWCRRGPPAARVDEVEVRREEYSGREKRFVIRYW
jgi:acylphosphatase